MFIDVTCKGRTRDCFLPNSYSSEGIAPWSPLTADSSISLPGSQTISLQDRERFSLFSSRCCEGTQSEDVTGRTLANGHSEREIQLRSVLHLNQ